jgi:hypothetical protein
LPKGFFVSGASESSAAARLAQGQGVSLGCGTLILIALIVLFFSRAGTGDLEREVRALRSEIGELKKAVEAQTGQIKALQERLDKAKALN